MTVNNVPKFVQQRMAAKRRERKSVMSAGDVITKEKTSSFSGFESAKKKYEHKHKEKLAKDEAKLEKEKKQAESALNRKKEGKLFRKKNERGQPNMGSQLEILLNRFNR